MKKRVLLDTHVFLWAIADDARLSRTHCRIYIDGTSEPWLSVASVWEVLIKSGLGKLSVPKPAAGWIAKQMELNRVGMLVAQANAESLSILSDDAVVRKYAVAVL